jgi:hypothetical protein
MSCSPSGGDSWRNLAAGGQVPDGIAAANGQAGGGAAEPHGLIKTRETHLQVAPMAAEAHHPPGLVGGEQHREIQSF